MKKLPIGIQTFSEIILGNYLYIDKTQAILNVISLGKYFFISRPRRFGKSLLVSTLYEIFSGNRELFQGLYIYDKIEWKPHPVIHIDLSLIPRENETQLREGLLYFVQKAASQHQLTLNTQQYDLAFQELIVKLGEKYQEKVVVLIDEYDKPLLDRIDNLELAHKNRDVLKNFYGVLKGSDQHLRFVFITGVSKFARVSIFSGLNNLDDITVDARFATIAGLTQDEVENAFPEYLAKFQQHAGYSGEELLELIRFWYNGYSWDGVTRLYNPFSLLNLFAKMEFRNYWFATGTPTFLIKKFREQQIDISTLEQQRLGLPAFDTYDIEHLEMAALLFQTGYLSIKGFKKARHGAKTYILSYPNFEVQESLLTYLLSDFSGEPAPKVQPLHEEMYMYLEEEKLDAFIQLMQTLISGIPYPLHIKEEAYYHSLFYMILKLLGADVDAEVLTDKGRIDGVLEYDDRIYIIECKYGKPGRKMETITQTAIRQIYEKKYYEPFLKSGKKIVLLGIGFVDKTLGYQVEPVLLT